jgi:hypothetical protein
MIPATIIRAMAKKELRETAGIVVLAMLTYLALVGRAVEAYQIFNDSFEAIPFVSGDFDEYYVVLTSVFALALGWRQSGWEGLRGTYVFLLHRPATRTAMITTKVATGLALLLALGVWPILIYALWASTPGKHASPFEWSMTVPAWSHWMAAPVLYLGAFLTGLRSARWFGTKLLPLVAAGSCYYAFSFFESPWAVSTSVAIVGGLFFWAILQVATRRDYG